MSPSLFQKFKENIWIYDIENLAMRMWGSFVTKSIEEDLKHISALPLTSINLILFSHRFRVTSEAIKQIQFSGAMGKHPKLVSMISSEIPLELHFWS